MAKVILAEELARTSSGTGAELAIDRIPYLIILEYTAKATDINDQMNVFVDVLIGGKWVNVVRFFTTFGTEAYIGRQVFTLSSTGTESVIRCDGDCQNGIGRPMLFGNKARARWVIEQGADPDLGPGSFTFSVIMYPFSDA